MDIVKENEKFVKYYEVGIKKYIYRKSLIDFIRLRTCAKARNLMSLLQA
jgi:hypothetical protein